MLKQERSIAFIYWRPVTGIRESDPGTGPTIFDKTEGIAQGRRVANYVFSNAFRPVLPHNGP